MKILQIYASKRIITLNVLNTFLLKHTFAEFEVR